MIFVFKLKTSRERKLLSREDTAELSRAAHSAARGESEGGGGQGASNQHRGLLTFLPKHKRGNPEFEVGPGATR